jgi:hypothetical protein
MDTELLTYRELADRLGVKLDSARRMVRRKGWLRVQGNDGQVRIKVPSEALPAAHREEPKDDPADSPQEAVSVLQERIAGLRLLLEIEQRRAAAAELDRDRWYELANRPWWRRLAG